MAQQGCWLQSDDARGPVTQPAGARGPNGRGDLRAKSRHPAGRQTAGACPRQEPGFVGASPRAAEIISQAPAQEYPLPHRVPVEEPAGRHFATHSTKSGNPEATGQKYPDPSTDGTRAGRERAFLGPFMNGTQQALHKDQTCEYI